MIRYSRAQAIAESVVFIPLALFALFAVMWAAQYGVQSERVESAIRYSGLVSNQIDPYQQYSLYVMYNSLQPDEANPPAPLPAQTCLAPTTDALTNSNTYPGPTMAPFWLNSPAPATVECVNPNASGPPTSTTQSTEGSFVAGLTDPNVVLSNAPYLSLSVTVPSFLQPLLGASLSSTGEINFMKPADMGTTLRCFPGLQQSVAYGVAPTPQTTSPAATPSPIAEPMPSPSYIPLANGC
jgi:hypothetical protein